jgi:hypothetical protein
MREDLRVPRVLLSNQVRTEPRPILRVLHREPRLIEVDKGGVSFGGDRRGGLGYSLR